MIQAGQYTAGGGTTFQDGHLFFEDKELRKYRRKNHVCEWLHKYSGVTNSRWEGNFACSVSMKYWINRHRHRLTEENFLLEAGTELPRIFNIFVYTLVNKIIK